MTASTVCSVNLFLLLSLLERNKTDLLFIASHNYFHLCSHGNTVTPGVMCRLCLCYVPIYAELICAPKEDAIFFPRVILYNFYLFWLIYGGLGFGVWGWGLILVFGVGVFS